MGTTETSREVRHGELRAMLRLAGEAGELPADSDARRRHLLAGVCELVGARAAYMFVMGRDTLGGALADDAGTFTSVGLAPAHASQFLRYLLDPVPRLRNPLVPLALGWASPLVCLHRRQFRKVPSEAWYRTGYFQDFLAPMGLDEKLYARLPTADGRLLGVAVCRPLKDRPFTDRECRLVDLFHADAGKLYGTYAAGPAGPGQPPARGPLPLGLAAGDPDVAALPPRLRAVLDRLLRGDGEKQAAARLGLSRHTVHEYVKMLYRKLNVSSRGELLARFVRPALPIAAGLAPAGGPSQAPPAPDAPAGS